MRDHQPISINKFNGLWARNPLDSCPKDHFSAMGNVTLTQTSFKTRPGLLNYLPFQNVQRIYTYIKTNSQSLLVLDNMGNIFDTGSPTPSVPILTINGMTDFGFVSINGRAYISPSNGTNGLSGQFIYVYKGDGTAARKAGATPPANGGSAFAAAVSATAGNVESGTHLYGVIFETDTGFLSAIGPVAVGVYGIVSLVSDGTKSVDLTHIPIGDSSVVARRIVATQAIQSFNGNLVGYNFWQVPGGRIADNSTTSLTINFYDAQLVADASHLLNAFTNIPAGVMLTTFGTRLISLAENGGNSVVRVSAPGEPEAVDQITGLITPPLDSHALTYAQEFRGALLLYKNDKTYAYTDNGNTPVNWPLQKIDNGIGTFTHGIATMLDSAGANIDKLIQLTFTGIYLFNGFYVEPELSWKIRDFWLGLGTANVNRYQIVIDPIKKYIYISLLNSTLLVGDYSQGLDPQSIRWMLWTFNIETDTIALVNENQLIIGSQQAS